MPCIQNEKRKMAHIKEHDLPNSTQSNPTTPNINQSMPNNTNQNVADSVPNIPIVQKKTSSNHVTTNGCKAKTGPTKASGRVRLTYLIVSNEYFRPCGSCFQYIELWCMEKLTKIAPLVTFYIMRVCVSSNNSQCAFSLPCRRY